MGILIVLLPCRVQHDAAGVVDFRSLSNSLSIPSGSALSRGGDRSSSESSIGPIGRGLALKSYWGGLTGGADSPLGSLLAGSSTGYVGGDLSSWWSRMDMSNLISRAMKNHPMEITLPRYCVDVSAE
jgi:hypothetical protein